MAVSWSAVRSLRPFHEKSEDLAGELFRFLSDATSRAETTTLDRDELDELFKSFKGALKAIAEVSAKPSRASRLALISLIESLSLQPDGRSEKLFLDMVTLLTRLIDAKPAYKYKTLMHFAVAGIGVLAKVGTPQGALNILIVLNSCLKATPADVDNLTGYRATLLVSVAKATRRAGLAALERDPALVKSLWKHSRSALEDPAAIVASAAFDVLSQIRLHRDDPVHLFLKASGRPLVIASAARFLEAQEVPLEKLIALYSTYPECFFPMSLLVGPTTPLKMLVDIAANEKFVGEIEVRARSDARKLVNIVFEQLSNEQVVEASGALIGLRSSCAFECLKDAVDRLGESSGLFALRIHTSILQVLSDEESSWPVCVAALRCLSSILAADPKLIVPTMEQGLKESEKNNGCTTQNAYLLALSLAATSHQPALGSISLTSRALALGGQLVRNDVKQSRSGWILLSGTMTLGPSVVRPHLPHFLSLWARAAIHYPPALTSIASFMVHNQVLLTPDVANKIGDILGDVWTSEKPYLLRLLQCYDLLSTVAKSDYYPASLVTKCVEIFLGATSQEIISDYYSEPDHILLEWPAKSSMQSSVEAAINIAAKTLPHQALRVQESLLDQIRSRVDFVSRRNSNEPASIMTARNVGRFLCRALADKKGVEIFAEPRISRVVEDLLNVLITHEDLTVQSLTSDAYKLLAEVHKKVGGKGDSALAISLLESITKDLDPIRRKGRSIALGAVLALRGANGIFARQAISIMTSLVFDPNPDVHNGVLMGFERALSSAAPTDPHLVNSILNAVYRTYQLESHGSEVGSATLSNAAFEESPEDVMAKILATAVASSGPELTGSPKTLSCIQRLLGQICRPGRWRTPLAVAQGWISAQELFYFAREAVAWPAMISQWVATVSTPRVDHNLLTAALDGILMLVRQQPRALAGLDIERRLWVLIDRKPKLETPRKILVAWFERTSTDSRWLFRLQSVILKPRRTFTDDDNAEQSFGNMDAVADEDQALGVSSDMANNELMSWEARCIAIDLLCSFVKREVEATPPRQLQGSLVARAAGDLIRTAFAAATSSVPSLQKGGLSLLDNIVCNLGNIRDPDFPTVSLLEQYQVQISSALTTAFGKDGSPDAAMAALDTCGAFIASGIYGTSDKLSRLLKVLAESLNSFKQEFRLGHLQLSPNGCLVLRTAVLRTWAVIAVASYSSEELYSLVPHAELVPLWAEELRKYAHLCFEPEPVSANSLSESLAQTEGAQLREVVMPVYRKSWLDYVGALTCENSAHKENETVPEYMQDYLESEVLFGLCFEALVNPHIDVADRDRILRALDRILHDNPDLLDDEGVFVDFSAALARATAVGSLTNQRNAISIATSLAHCSKETDESVDRLFELLQVATMPLRKIIPKLFGLETAVSADPSLTGATLDALIEIVTKFRDVIQRDLWLCLVKIYEFMGTAPKPLLMQGSASYKRFLETLSSAAELNDTSRELIVDILRYTLTHLSRDEEVSLLTGTAVLCTNYQLVSDYPTLAYDFGRKVADCLKSSELGDIALQCAHAIFLAAAGHPTGNSFAYAFVPTLIDNLSKNPSVACDMLALFSGRLKDPEAVYTSLCVTIPTLLRLVQMIPDLEDRVRRRLMQLAMKHTNEFKEVLGSSIEVDRAEIQQLLVQTSNSEETFEGEEIVLTSFT